MTEEISSANINIRVFGDDTYTNHTIVLFSKKKDLALFSLPYFRTLLFHMARLTDV